MYRVQVEQQLHVSCTSGAATTCIVYMWSSNYMHHVHVEQQLHASCTSGAAITCIMYKWSSNYMHHVQVEQQLHVSCCLPIVFHQLDGCRTTHIHIIICIASSINRVANWHLPLSSVNHQQYRSIHVYVHSTHKHNRPCTPHGQYYTTSSDSPRLPDSAG